MNAGKAVYGILSANSSVTDIVGTNIFPEIAEQETAVPFVVYQLQSVDPDDTHDGPSKLDEVRFEFLCYADSYNAAADLGVAVRAALDRVSGTYNGVHVESVQFNDVDVNIEYDPRRYSQVLTFTFRIKRDDVTIALGTPVTGAVLGDLSDVDVTGVTNGQLIAYNSTSGNWEAANDAGGANELSDLSDANVSLPSDGEVLIYSGGEFVNDNIAISNVTGLQAALDAAPDNLRELTDVTISGLADNDYLQYDSASGTWQNSTLILGRNGEQYTGNYDSEAETLRAGATATVELYYTAQADGDGLAESAESDTATAGYDIRRKLYYAEKAQADPNTSGDWTQFADIADDTTYASAKATLLAYLKARTGGTVPISLKMTWEEVAEAPAFTGLLNESYGSGAAAAYSVRRLNGNYTGAAIEVERSSDNTTQDIGFDSNGDLDESALTTFCTGTTCKVRTWYDQATAGGTGSGNDAVQTTHANQPTIYTGGAIVKENGRVAFDYAGSQLLRAAISATITSESIFATTTIENSGRWNRVISQAGATGGDTGSYIPMIQQDNFGIVGGFDGSFRAGVAFDYARQLLFSAINTGSALTNYVSGTAGTASSYSLNETIGSLGIGDAPNGGSSGEKLSGNMHEVVVYHSDKSTDRTSIESNIGDYFTQNTPLLDTYTGAAAAYSLRRLSSSYSGSAIRVRRASDNTEQDIGFNVFGELSTVELADFCGSSDGFVKIWYCQSGNANDATQTTAANQPKIYDGTTGVVTEGTKPAINLDSNDFFDLGSLSAASGDNVSYYWVGDWTGETSNNNRWILHGDDTNAYLAPVSTNGNSNNGTTGLTSVTGYKDGVSVAVATRDNVHDAFTSVYHLGELYGTTTTSFSSTELGRYPIGNNFYLNGNIQEFILYTSDQSSNRANIEDNINTFYDIY